MNIKDVNEAGGGAGVITTVSLDGLNGASNIYDNALTNLTVNDSFVGTSVAIVEGASTSATILALSINNDPGLTLNDVGNKYATVNVTIGAQASSLTIDDAALTTLTIFGPSGSFGPAGSLAITDNSTALTTINAAADTGALTIVAAATGLTIINGTGSDSITNSNANGVITEGATAATLSNTLTVSGAGATINDQASAGVDTINLGGANETVNLGSGGTAAASTTVNVSNAPSPAAVVDTVNFGSGIAIVTDHLAYQAVASASTSNTDGNLLALTGTLHGEISGLLVRRREHRRRRLARRPMSRRRRTSIRRCSLASWLRPIRWPGSNLRGIPISRTLGPTRPPTEPPARNSSRSPEPSTCRMRRSEADI